MRELLETLNDSQRAHAFHYLAREWRPLIGHAADLDDLVTRAAGSYLARKHARRLAEASPMVPTATYRPNDGERVITLAILAAAHAPSLDASGDLEREPASPRTRNRKGSNAPDPIKAAAARPTNAFDRRSTLLTHWADDFARRATGNVNEVRRRDWDTETDDAEYMPHLEGGRYWHPREMTSDLSSTVYVNAQGQQYEHADPRIESVSESPRWANLTGHVTRVRQDSDDPTALIVTTRGTSPKPDRVIETRNERGQLTERRVIVPPMERHTARFTGHGPAVNALKAQTVRKMAVRKVKRAKVTNARAELMRSLAALKCDAMLTYGTWQLRCLKPAIPSRKVAAVIQVTNDQGETAVGTPRAVLSLVSPSAR